MQQHYVYILAGRSKVLYVGMTSDLGRRISEHKTKAVASSTPLAKPALSGAEQARAVQPELAEWGWDEGDQLRARSIEMDFTKNRSQGVTDA